MSEEQPQILRLRLAEKRPNSAQDDIWIYDANFGDRRQAASFQLSVVKSPSFARGDTCGTERFLNARREEPRPCLCDSEDAVEEADDVLPDEVVGGDAAAKADGDESVGHWTDVKPCGVSGSQSEDAERMGDKGSRGQQ